MAGLYAHVKGEERIKSYKSSKMSVEIRHIDPSKGNGLFAKRQIKSGETIFEENPLVSAQFSWNAAYGYNACDHCLR